MLGDLNAVVDWGYAGDYAEAMTRILGHATPEDFVVATGEPHTVREFLQDRLRNRRRGLARMCRHR